MVDLLDAEGSAELAGKHVGKDAARGKLTYPGIWGADDSRLDLRDRLSALIRFIRDSNPSYERVVA